MSPSCMLNEQIGRQGMLKNIVTIAVLSILANIFLGAFYIYLGRRLGPETYADFGSLLSIYLGAMFVSGVVGIVVMRYISFFTAKSQEEKIARLAKASTFRMGIVGGGFFIAVAVFAPLIAAFLRIDSPWLILLLGFLIWVSVVLQNLLSIVNGLQRFKELGISRLIVSAVAFVACVIFVELGAPVSGPFYGLIIGTLVVVYLTRKKLSFIFDRHIHRIGKAGIRSYILHAVILSVALGVMLNLDVILVKYYLPAIQAGYYVAASMMAKIAFMVSTGVVTVSFPKVALLHAEGRDTLPLLKDALKYTLVPSGVIVILFLLLPGFITNVAFGSAYELRGVLQPLAAAMLLLAFSNIIAMHHLATKRFRILYYAAPFALLELLLIQLFHGSLYQVVWAIFFVTLTQAAAVAYLARDELRELFGKRTLQRIPLEFYLRLKSNGKIKP
ncbi:MAG: oligosaccharide flippase family protein [archaeon]